jgi:molecular chaperone DnaK
MNKKGTELSTSNSPTQVSITIGNTTLNQPGRPVAVNFEKQTAHVYLMIDTSGSMADLKIEQAKRGILDFAKDAFRKEYDVGLIRFDTEAKLLCKPTHNLQELTPHVNGLYASGTTNMTEAIILAHELLNSMKNTRVMVIATDGVPNNPQDTINEATRCKKDGIDIITIGTDDADQQFLKNIASRSELGNKVPRAVFSQAISSASNLLPPPKSMTKRKGL